MTAPVYVVQGDFAVGDIKGNRNKLIDASHAAKRAGAEVVIAPELALSGYPPEDLLFDGDFIAALSDAVAVICAKAEPSVALLFGAPNAEGGVITNAAILVRGGKTEGIYAKAHLPNTSVFDDKRYFVAGDGIPLVFSAGGETYAVQVCEDIWHPQQADKVRKSGAKNTLALNGSPFDINKHRRRLSAAADFARTSQTTVFYCNTVGGQDELIFDGASFVVNDEGKVVCQMAAFAEAQGLIREYHHQYPACEDAMVYDALVMAVRDYAKKTGIGAAVLGLSGGVDSALVATIAADALGAENITAVMMPSPHTSAESIDDAAKIAENLGCDYMTMPITPMMAAAEQTLAQHLTPRAEDVTMENVQARLRGMLLMALANNRGGLLLATGNKSEAACGYATLYGDMCGGFAPLKDASKTRVWRLAKYRNKQGEVIPPRVISRAPSAELKPGQKDEDSLPPYDVVDSIVAAHLAEGKRLPPMREKFDADALSAVLTMMTKSEHKRRQAAMGPKLTECAFGRDRRMPVANRFTILGDGDD
ncbi:MAG: NAD+ synthase [Gammaproteobacteria bacterium]